MIPFGFFFSDRIRHKNRTLPHSLSSSLLFVSSLSTQLWVLIQHNKRSP